MVLSVQLREGMGFSMARGIYWLRGCIVPLTGRREGNDAIGRRNYSNGELKNKSLSWTFV